MAKTTITFTEEALKKGVDLLNKGATKGKIEAFAMYTMDTSTNEAKQYAAEVFAKAGKPLNTRGDGTDWSATVAYLRKNYGKLPKKELIEGMCKVNGKKYSSNQHAYNYIAMAQEWAKQECGEE